MPESRYAVEVLHLRGSGATAEWTVASGYCVGGRYVLTAGHAVGPGSVSVRFWGGVVLPAEVVAEGGGAADLALVRLLAPVSPEPPRVRVARVDTSRAALLYCQGVGYPWWKEGDRPADGPRPRGRAQLFGEVPTAEGPVGGQLTFHMRAAPGERAGGSGRSAWDSASGTVVFAGDGGGGEFAIGVVIEHRSRDGASAVTLEPLTVVDRMDPVNRARFRGVLWPRGGGDAPGHGGTGDLPVLVGTAYPHPGPPRHPERMSVRRILAAVVAAVVLVTGALWWSVRQDSVIDGLTPGEAVKVTLAGSTEPGEEGRWWVLKDPMPRPGPDTRIPRLAEAYGGAPLMGQDIRLTLEGNRRSTVVITDIGARIYGREAPYGGTAYQEASAGSTTALSIGLDLEEGSPRARTLDSGNGNGATLGKHHFDGSGLTLVRKEVASVTVSAYAKRSLVRFALVVSYAVDGRMESVEIKDENGRPFVVSGVPARLAGAYSRAPGARGWTASTTAGSDFLEYAVETRP
ncbi:hypothetical protein ACIRQY_31295 [Streptomyces sp. NPDC101490]|uniref:hypothetical protein n=1 Tax=Streptomyces sp. NPDC101490 TaxID=3366143 RepID=UPI003828764A